MLQNNTLNNTDILPNTLTLFKLDVDSVIRSQWHYARQAKTYYFFFTKAEALFVFGQMPELNA